MQTYVLLTRLLSEETNPSFSISQKERLVAENIRKLLPEVKWVANYAVLGPWDYIDLFEAPDMRTAMKMSSLVRYYGGAHTEVWPAVDWDSFNEDLNSLAYAMTG